MLPFQNYHSLAVLRIISSVFWCSWHGEIHLASGQVACKKLLQHYQVVDIELALGKSLWRLLVASGATHWHGACRIMMMMMSG